MRHLPRILPLAVACVATLAANCQPEPEKPPVPAITEITPNKGDLLGGTVVTIRGTGLKGVTDVKFDAGSWTAIVDGDGTSFTVTTPPAAAIGPVTVTLTNPGGTASLPNGFRYANVVNITALEPSTITANQPAVVTIRGSGFVPPVSVKLGTAAMMIAPIVGGAGTANAFPVSVPALPLGSYSVTVTNGDNEEGVSAAPLVVSEGISITEIDPNGGFSDESTPVRIVGRGFTGVTSVLVGNAACSNLQVTDTILTCLVPPGIAGPTDVIVRRSVGNENRLTAGFTYYSSTDATVHVLFATPPKAPTTGGRTVDIAATGLTLGTPQATIGGTAASMVEVVDGGKRVRVTVPPFTIVGTAVSQRVPIAVTVSGATDTKQNSFTYYIMPELGSVMPAKGATVGGDLVTVFGAGFTETGLAVAFDGVPATEVTRVTGTSLTCRIPPRPAGFADVIITTEFDQSTEYLSAFEYVEAVRITVLDPPTASIAGGTLVYATGSGYSLAPGRMRVTLGDENQVITQVTILSSSRFKMVLPPRMAPGAVRVRIEDTNPGDPELATGELNIAYVDNTIPIGGIGGGAINRNLSVTVLNRATGERISGAEVFLGNAWGDPNSMHHSTDSKGMTVIAADDLNGPLTVTAARENFENQTRVLVDASDITFALTPYTSTAPGTPQLGQLSGVIADWSRAGVPPGGAANQYKRLAVVYVSEPDQGIGPIYPGDFNIISEQPCDITRDNMTTSLPQSFTVDAEVGRRVALVAVVFFYDSKDGVCSPGSPQMPDMTGEGLAAATAGAMGILTGIDVQPGTNPGHNITINKTITTGMQVNLVGAPSAGGVGSTARTVDALLDLGDSGIFTFFNVIQDSATIPFNGSQPAQGLIFYDAANFMNQVATGVPAPGAEINYILHGVSGIPILAQGTNQMVGYTQPQTEVYKRNVNTNTVNLSNWFGFPDMQPNGGQTVVNRRLTWGGNPGQAVSFYTIDIGEQVDPMNIEPRWTAILPDTVDEFVIPDLAGAPNVTDLRSGSNLWQFGAYRIFDEDTFEYNNHANDRLGEAHWERRVLSSAAAFIMP